MKIENWAKMDSVGMVFIQSLALFVLTLTFSNLEKRETPKTSRRTTRKHSYVRKTIKNTFIITPRFPKFDPFVSDILVFIYIWENFYRTEGQQF